MDVISFSRGLPDLRSGVYQHFKGRFYLVLGYAKDANADGTINGLWASTKNGPQRLTERAVVVYVGLEIDSGVESGPRMNVRSATDFFALVCAESGKSFDKCRCLPEGHQPRPVARFEYKGPSWYTGWGS